MFIPSLLVQVLTVTWRICRLLTPQELFAVTVTCPDCVKKSTRIAGVPCPPVITDWGGTVQVYEVAPLTGDTEYATFFCFLQTSAGPVIAEGICGNPVTVMHDGLDVPQLLEDTTHRFPVVNIPLKETVTEFVPWPVAMVAPEG